MTWIVLDER